jgi:ATP-dependent DNA helicase RecG
VVSSPGGFPEGITAENILWKQKPRNRRIAETFSRAGLVERSGQGADLMFEWAIRDAKRLPDYGKSDLYEVVVRLDGQVRDERFVRFLEQIGNEQNISFGVEELLVLSTIRDGTSPGSDFTPVVQRLLGTGAIERVGRKKYVLSRRFYAMAGRKGEYTRKRGLDRETNKALLLQHIEQNQEKGSTAEEFQQVLPSLSRGQIYSLVNELAEEERIRKTGRTRGSRWFPCISPDESNN